MLYNKITGQFLTSLLNRITPCVFRSASTSSSCNRDGANAFANRTHTCGELNASHVGLDVKLCGWIQFVRYRRFVVLKDSYGSVQLFLSPKLPESVQHILSRSPLESVVSISGMVDTRPPKQANPSMRTGEIEVQVTGAELLNPCVDPAEMPILTGREYIEEHESQRMLYRYLDLRQPLLQHNIRLRSEIVHSMRKALIDSLSFVEIETPCLFRETPGGADEFMVPSSRHPGHFYSLPQSPQQFKQLLMVGGFDRYFQVARCFRDESSTPERQPEFTQLDIEVSFTDAPQIQSLIESIIRASWPDSIHGPFPSGPIKTLTYHKAMELYGSDKPDTRFECFARDFSYFIDLNASNQIITRNDSNDDSSNRSCVVGLSFPNSVRKVMDIPVRAKLVHAIEQRKLLSEFAIISSDREIFIESFPGAISEADLNNFFTKVETAPDELLVICWPKLTKPHDDSSTITRSTAGTLRKLIADIAEQHSPGCLFVADRKFEFLWITDFPLFEKKPADADTSRIEEPKSNFVLAPCHHPFTAPSMEHKAIVEQFVEQHFNGASGVEDRISKEDLLSITAQSYDLVLNGTELGGGSIRVHNAGLQEGLLKILNIDPASMDHFIKALRYGAPPHGGFALGLDRYIAILCSSNSIKDVIAFPKSYAGRDTMSSSPCRTSPERLKKYGLRLTEDDDGRAI